MAHDPRLLGPSKCATLCGLYYDAPAVALALDPDRAEPDKGARINPRGPDRRSLFGEIFGRV